MKKKSFCIVLAIIFIIIVFTVFINQISKNKKDGINDKIIKEQIELENNDIVLKEGESKYLKIIQNDKNYTYESSNPNVVSVSKDGKIYGVSNGFATVTIKNSNGSKTKCNVTVQSKIYELKLNKDSISLYEGETFDIEYSITPEFTEISDVEFNSDDPKVATFSSGRITAISKGETKLTVKINDCIEKDIDVVVKKRLKKVNIDNKKITLHKGDEQNLQYTITPLDATVEKKEFKSSNSDIVSVSSDGKLTAKKYGSVSIQVILNGNITDICEVVVERRKPASIKLDKSSYELKVGDTIKLSATISPEEASEDKVKWSTSDKKIVTVSSNGKIEGKVGGSAYVSVTTSNGHVARAKVTVKSNTQNKTAIFFGDSITQGVKTNNYSWANYIGDNYDLKKTVNSGRSGWRISNVTNSHWIVSLMDNYKSQKFDYVILHGGTNDIYKSVDIGTFDKNDFSGKYDTKTFVGGLETYIYTAKKYWPNAKIGYLINYPTPNSDEFRRNLSSSYYTVMKQVLNKWNIKYLDMFFGSTPNGIKYSDLLKVTTTKYLVDNLHLNSDGYKLISPYIYNWMNTL